MPAEFDQVAHAREMQKFETTMNGFGKTIGDMRDENKAARGDQAKRSDKFFEMLGATNESVAATNESVAVLAETVKNEREHTKTRFEGLWRWLVILGGGGASAGLANSAFNFLG